MASQALFQRRVMAALADTGLTAGQPKVLDYLGLHDGSIQKAIAAGCLILGAGVYMEVAAGVVMLPGECTVKALTLLGNTDFGKTKVAFDFTLAVGALVIGLVLFHAPAGIRDGTFISALTVGLIARAIDRAVGRRIQVLF